MSELVKHFGRNQVGRDILVGDIHGCFAKLQVALDEIGFDGRFDRLFSVGDLVDRGPDSHLALAWLDKPWFHAVRGNHEDMAIQFAAGLWDGGNYVANGGAWNAGNTASERADFALTVADLPVAFELETEQGLVGIVHAECPTHDWSALTGALQSAEPEAAIESCLWGRQRYEFAVAQGKGFQVAGVRAVVCGHTVVKRPQWIANHLLIDTGICYGGAVTLIDAATLDQAKPLVRKPRDLSHLINTNDLPQPWNEPARAMSATFGVPLATAH